MKDSWSFALFLVLSSNHVYFKAYHLPSDPAKPAKPASLMTSPPHQWVPSRSPPWTKLRPPFFTSAQHGWLKHTQTMCQGRSHYPIREGWLTTAVFCWPPKMTGSEWTWWLECDRGSWSLTFRFDWLAERLDGCLVRALRHQGLINAQRPNTSAGIPHPRQLPEFLLKSFPPTKPPWKHRWIGWWVWPKQKWGGHQERWGVQLINWY